MSSGLRLARSRVPGSRMDGAFKIDNDVNMPFSDPMHITCHVYLTT
jgi:hypothetical protein